MEYEGDLTGASGYLEDDNLNDSVWVDWADDDIDSDD